MCIPSLSSTDFGILSHVILDVCLLLLPLVDYGLSCLDGGNSLEDVRYFLFGSGYERENVGDIVLLPSGVLALAREYPGTRATH